MTRRHANRDDAERWIERKAGVRLLPPEATTRLVRVVAALYVSTGSAGMVPVLTSASLTDPMLLAAMSLLAIAAGVGLLVLDVLWSDELMARVYPWLVWALLITASTVLSVGIYAAGPAFQVTTPIYAVEALFSVYLLRRPYAVAYLGLIGIQFGVTLAVEGGMAAPAAQWIYLMIVVTATAFVVGTYVAETDLIAASEHRSRMALAQINDELEERVATQVAELERLGGLRRFLSTPVADAVLSADGAALLAPHRGQIAVFFCDLRGFTAFSARSQPEEVAAVLSEYFDLLGDAVARYEATVGAFTGDGLMAFFNDPLPCPDPAARAVAMAMDLQHRMGCVVEGWARRGVTLGFGVGIAYGYANIGLIGFEGRRDYSALGPVVNMAARLCAEAPAGCTYIDQPTRGAIDGQIPMDAFELSLKGYDQPVHAFSLRSDTGH